MPLGAAASSWGAAGCVIGGRRRKGLGASATDGSWASSRLVVGSLAKKVWAVTAAYFGEDHIKESLLFACLVLGWLKCTRLSHNLSFSLFLNYFR